MGYIIIEYNNNRCLISGSDYWKVVMETILTSDSTIFKNRLDDVIGRWNNYRKEGKKTR